MHSGTCPTCARPYTVSEIAGFGILRGRPPERGGPLMEFSCPGCKRLLQLVPHGDGRYAPPGQPPPPAPSAEERLPPWLKERARGKRKARTKPPKPAPQTAPRPEQEEAPPPPTHEVEEPAPPPEEAPIGLREALEVLGVSPGADLPAIERAFRERSRTCHPDKVAHLDAEFQELAERKFKRLRQALDLLRS
jgi:hypothetical protein